MAERKSFMLYLDSEAQFELLTDEQAGKLIKALIKYAKYEENPDFEDGMLKMAFSFISSQIRRDSEKYERRCERNRQIALEREKQRKESTNVHERART